MRKYWQARLHFLILFTIILGSSCAKRKLQESTYIQLIDAKIPLDTTELWLTHEHILVDFIGAGSISKYDWNVDSVIETMVPFLNEIKLLDLDYFVDATPNHLGRDIELLQRISNITGLKILTNTGFYGAGNNKYLPSFALDMSAEEIASLWIAEFKGGIDRSNVKPGFIKIGIDNINPLSEMHQTIVKAAAFTHLQTGLTIASHTGPAKGMWPQVRILQDNGVAPEAFIWVHAQAERDYREYVKAAKLGCWISLDGLGWELDDHLNKLLYAKEKDILDKLLISHDAGWYDPQKETQEIRPYTDIFNKLIPELLFNGFTECDLEQIMCVNPVRAFAISIKHK